MRESFEQALRHSGDMLTYTTKYQSQGKIERLARDSGTMIIYESDQELRARFIKWAKVQPE